MRHLGPVVMMAWQAMVAMVERAINGEDDNDEQRMANGLRKMEMGMAR